MIHFFTKFSSLKSFKSLKPKSVDGGYEFQYEYVGSKKKRIELPAITMPNGSKVDYIEYSIRDNEGGGINATTRRILHFNDISFEIDQYARYEGIWDNEVLSLPPMKLTQGPGDNIIQKGDVFSIGFNSSLPLSFSDVPEDSLFDIDITGKSALELT